MQKITLGAALARNSAWGPGLCPTNLKALLTANGPSIPKLRAMVAVPPLAGILLSNGQNKGVSGFSTKQGRKEEPLEWFPDYESTYAISTWRTAVGSLTTFLAVR